MEEVLPAGLVNGVGVAALLVGLFWMLATGRLCTGRELREQEKRIVEQSERIAVLEAQVRTRDEQVDLALAVLPEVAGVLRKFHVAAEESREASG